MKKMITSILLTYSLAMADGDIVMKENVAVDPVPMATEESSEWKHSIAIYGWLPTFDGTLKYNIPGEDGEPDGTGESDIMDKIDGVFMGSYAVRKNKWSFFADMIYLKMSDSQGVSGTIPILDHSFNVSSDQELITWVISGYAGYNLVENGTHTINAIAGLRYLSLDLDISLDLTVVNDRHRSVSKTAEFYDGVIGVQGISNLNENWYIPYHLDIGTGDSDLTAQVSAGLGYSFGWGDVLLEYRYLYYDNGTDTFVNSLDAYGPKLGVVFHF